MPDSGPDERQASEGELCCLKPGNGSAHIARIRDQPWLSDERIRAWGEVAVSVAQRGAGESLWRMPEHRLGMRLTPVAKATLTFEGRVLSFIHEPLHHFAFYPLGSTARVQQKVASKGLNILFSPEIFRRAAYETLDPREIGLDLLLSGEKPDPTICQLALAIAHEVAGPGFADRILVEGLSAALAVQLMRRLADGRPSQAPYPRGLSRERLRRVIEYIEAHLGEEGLSLSELSRVVYLSPHHFSRAFRYATGITPHRFVTHRRLERAKTLIRTTDMQMAEIAYAAGFGSQAHFTTRFRQATGVTPLQFRRSLI